VKIYPIVEGHGEVQAAPVLMRRLLEQAQCYDVGVGSPIKRTQAQLRGEQSIHDAVQLARLQPDCSALLILFDGEDGCPRELAERVRTWARAAAGATPCDVVVAFREYETWFLAAVESLRGQRGIRDDAVAPDDPEARRDAKGALEELMSAHRSYSETQDQPALSATFDLALAFRRNRSFRKLVTSIGALLTGLGLPLAEWPPTSWRSQRQR
jgi:hypothetical protein